tara:strand:+ start:140 stop:706 length:567 start_codon:yes stop_codon:yes gene_type:complete
MRKIKYIFIILFSILISSNSSSDELNILFLKLKNAKNFSEATKVEKKIWNIWVTNGSNKKNNLEMNKGIMFLNNGNLNNALKVFLNLSKVEPEWAEPLNKVATIKFLQKDYLTSIKYIKLTLKKEKRHFGAISGLAQINLRLGRFENALKNINQALKIHPFIGIKKIKPLLLEKLNKRAIKLHLNFIN